MDTEQLIAELEALGPGEGSERLRELIDSGQVDTADLQLVEQHFAQVDPIQWEAVVEIADFQGRLQTERQLEDDTLETQAQAREQERIESDITELRESGASETEVRSELERRGEDSGSINSTLGELNVPLEFLQMAGLSQDLTPEQAADLLEDFSLATGQEFRDFEELLESGVLQDPRNQQIVRALVPEQEPQVITSFDIPLMSGEKVSITGDQLQQAQQALQMDQRQLTTIARLGDTYDIRRADGTGVAWQPLSLLMRVAGNLPVSQQGRENRAALYQEQRRARAAFEQAERAGSALPPAAIQELREKYEAAKKAYLESGDRLNTAAPGMTNSEMAQRYKEGLRRFSGNEGLAFVGAINPSLANKLFASNGDMEKVSYEDGRLIGQIMSEALPGAADTDDLIAGLVGMGYGEAAGSSSLAVLLSQLAARSGGGSAGRVRIKTDPTAIRQAAKDLYRQMFRADPTDEQLAGFVSQAQSAEASAPDDQNVDIGAAIREGMEATREYQRLYGKKPSGLTESEYQGQFAAAQASILGNEVAGDSAVRLGMASGKFQTAVGAAAGTAEAWDNSTFLGRLARAGQMFETLT